MVKTPKAHSAPRAKTGKKPVAPKPKFSFRRNIVPPLLGILMMVSIFALLNAQLIVAKYAYYVAPPAPTAIGPEPTSVDPKASSIIITSLNIHAPIIVEPSVHEPTVQKALQNGVVHYGSTAPFGSEGNAVIFGHSSGTPWAPGNYKYVFTVLDKIKEGAKIIVDYKGTRYTYLVRSTEVVLPTDVRVLNQPKGKNQLTLITCTPAGSNKKRLVVHAEQISPKPAASVAKPSAASAQNSPAPSTNSLPTGASQSLWQAIKDLF